MSKAKLRIIAKQNNCIEQKINIEELIEDINIYKNYCEAGKAFAIYISFFKIFNLYMLDFMESDMLYNLKQKKFIFKLLKIYNNEHKKQYAQFKIYLQK